MESLLTKFDEACAGGVQRRSSSEPKRASTARPTAPAARPVAVGGVAEPGTAAGTGAAAALVTVEKPATAQNRGEGAAAVEGATGESATGQPPSPAERAAMEQETGASLPATGEAGAPAAATAGRGRRKIARQKSKAALDGRKAEAVLGGGRRETKLGPKNSARNSNVSCSPGAK